MKKLALILSTAFVVSSAQAQPNSEEHYSEDQWEFELGVGAASYNSLYKGVKKQNAALPLIGVRYNEFFFDGGAVGYEFYQDEEQSAYVSIGMDDPFDGERSDSKNKAISRLGDVDSGVNLSVGGEVITSVGLVSAKISADVSGEHDGASVSVGWAVPIELEKLTVMPNVEFTWASEDLVNHYYGVSTKQAAKSGLAKHSTGSATIASVGVNAEYMMTDQWSLLGGMSYTKYSGNINKSTLTQRDDSTDAFLGVIYRF